MLFMNDRKLKDFEALKWNEEKASVLHYEERCLGRLMWWPAYERGVGGRWREGGEKGEDSSVENLNIWGGGCMVIASLNSWGRISFAALLWKCTWYLFVKYCGWPKQFPSVFYPGYYLLLKRQRCDFPDELAGPHFCY